MAQRRWIQGCRRNLVRRAENTIPSEYATAHTAGQVINTNTN